MSLRKIIQVDVDAFYAFVEQGDDPKSRGKTLVAPGAVVCAAFMRRQEFRRRLAPASVRAECLWPDAIFVAPDLPPYKRGQGI